MVSRFRPLFCFAFSVLGFLACAGADKPKQTQAPTVTVPSGAPADQPPAAAPSAETPSTSCLMVNVCQCNLGCALIDVPESKLRPGLVATVMKGALEKEKVKVVE